MRDIFILLLILSTIAVFIVPFITVLLFTLIIGIILKITDKVIEIYHKVIDNKKIDNLYLRLSDCDGMCNNCPDKLKVRCKKERD